MEENNLTEEEIAKRFNLNQNDVTYDQVNDICVTAITFKRPEQRQTALETIPELAASIYRDTETK